MADGPQHGTRHELLRVNREPITYELFTDGVLTVRAVASGPLLLDGAALQPVDGPGPWSLKPMRRVAPKSWELSTPDGDVHARCKVAYRKRGGTAVDLQDGPDDLRFDPTDNPILDTVKAMALADTGKFALRRGKEVVARTGHRRCDMARRRQDGARRPTQVLWTEPGASWQPDPVLACALLVFRIHVVTSFRSP